MRTTVDIQPDVLSAAKQIAVHQAITLGAALTNLARMGLQAQRVDAIQAEKKRKVNRNGFPLLGGVKGAPAITIEDVHAAQDD